MAKIPSLEEAAMLNDAEVEAIARAIVKADGRNPDDKSYPSMIEGDPPEVAWESEAGLVRKVAIILEQIERIRSPVPQKR